MYRTHIELTDLSSVRCSPDTELREVMRAFNEAVQMFRLVLDDQGHLLGTITDGDVRRALLNGLDLGTPARDCMHTPPLSGHVNDRWDDVNKPPSIHFLPLLDDEAVVCSVLVPAQATSPIKTALVMAGGLGRRLGEMTRHTPKPLIPVRGKPILEHILLQLESIGVERIYISVHYLPERIEDFVQARDNKTEIHLLHETEMKGTAGALSLLPEIPDHPILVMNGDVITDINYAALSHFHDERGVDATIGISDYQVNIPFGVVIPGDDGLFKGIDEKPVLQFPIVAGIYLLAPPLVALVPQTGVIDMPDLLNLALAHGHDIGTFPIHEYWIDVGRAEDLKKAENGPRQNQEEGHA